MKRLRVAEHVKSRALVCPWLLALLITACGNERTSVDTGTEQHPPGDGGQSPDSPADSSTDDEEETETGTPAQEETDSETDGAPPDASVGSETDEPAEDAQAPQEEAGSDSPEDAASTPDAADEDGGGTDADDASTAEDEQPPEAGPPEMGEEDADPPESPMFPAAVPLAELASELEGYWLTDAQIGGCGDVYRYDYFQAPSELLRIAWSSPGCSTTLPDGRSEYPGSYELSGRRLTTVAEDTGRVDTYDIAMELTEIGLTLYPGIYLPLGEGDWERNDLKGRQDEDAALEWSVISTLRITFGSGLPLADDAPCSVTVSFDIELSGFDPEGSHTGEVGPYTCSHEQSGTGRLIQVPGAAPEDISHLDDAVQDELLDYWPTSLRLPRADAEYLLPPGGHTKVDESDVQD